MRKKLLPILLTALIPLSACVTREQVEADIWANDQIPEALCAPDSDLWNYGIARVVECKRLDRKIPQQNEWWNLYCEGKPEDQTFEQFIPYCDPVMQEYLSMHREDATKWLDKLTRPKPR